MIDIQLNYNYGYRWYSEDNVCVKGAAFYEGTFLEADALLNPFKGISSPDAFQQILSKLNGIFSVIILVDNITVLAAVDPLRNFPLLYSYQNDYLLISDDYRTFKEHFPVTINETAKRLMLSFGYVLGTATLLNQVFQLQAGTFLSTEKQKLTVATWRHFPSIQPEKTRAEWKNELRSQFVLLSERLKQMVGNKPVALPLSGGFDSRLIAILLKMQNHQNVICLTYGNPDYYEAKISKKVAEQLGFKWTFIDYNPYRNGHYIHTEQFQIYADFAGNALAFPYNLEFFAAKELREGHHLPDHTIFLPGHSGDMLAGSHLFPDMQHFSSKQDLAKKILRTNGNHLELSKKEVQQLIIEIEKNLYTEQTGLSHLAHDNWNIYERQSKQIVNASKPWMFFNYQYLLPLWDTCFTDFFLSVPFSHRVYKNLYDEVVKELFLEYDVWPPEGQGYSIQFKRKSFRKLKIKEKFPVLIKIKKRLSDEPKDNFFFFDDLIAPMLQEIEPLPKHSSGTAVLSAWHIKQVKKHTQTDSLPLLVKKTHPQ